MSDGLCSSVDRTNERMNERTNDRASTVTLAHAPRVNDGTPYQSLKCTNQIGLVVDGNVTNYQGIVRCTTVPGLNTDSNYMAVYTDSVFEALRTLVSLT